MFYKKQGYPEEGENVVCTVTKIQHHSVFANLNQFPGKSGLLHISEISPGRVRNIYDYVKEGKVIVCKVLAVKSDRGHIDLSLRRVSESQRIRLMSDIKKEQKAEKIIEDAAKELKEDVKKLYDKIANAILSEYQFIYDYFFAIIKDEAEIAEMKLAAKESAKLEELIRQRIKKPLVHVGGKLTIISHAGDGVDVVRNILQKMDDVDERIKITYGGGGHYNVHIVCEDFKDAEDVLKKALDIGNAGTSKDTSLAFDRDDGKYLEE